MSTTGSALITNAYELLGVIQPGDTPEPVLMQRGLSRMNRMLSGWALQSLTIPVIARQVFPLTSNVGVYMIGPGGDFDTSRPTMLSGAAVLLNNAQTPTAVTSIASSGTVATVTITSHGKSVGDGFTISGALPAAFNGTFTVATVPTPNTFTYLFPGSVSSPSTGTITALFESSVTGVTEIPCPIITDDARQWIQIKSLKNALATSVYYNPTYSGGLGTIDLWPIPTVNTNALVLYRPMQLDSFVTLSQSVDLPEGAEEAIEYNLAFRLCAPNGVQPPADVVELARTSLGTYKRANTKMADVVLDPMFTQERRGGYNILTGGNSRGGTR